MLVAYVSGHGFGHATRLCEVLRAVRGRAPALPFTLVGDVREDVLLHDLAGPVRARRLPCDVGLVQRDALEIDEAATAMRCREFERDWDERVETEAAFLREVGARLVLGDIPPLAFAAARRARIPSLGLGNFSWDWIYRHYAARHPSLATSAERAARAYADAELLLELPFAGDLSAFARRERIGLVARRPRVPRGVARRRLGLGERPAVLVSFGGVGLPGLAPGVLRREARVEFLFPEDLGPGRLRALELSYADVVGAADVVLTKPGYGIVSDAIAARTRVVYPDRGDFPEYPIMVREMALHLACVYVPSEDVRAGRVSDAISRALALEPPDAPDLDGAERAAARVVEALG